MLFIMRSLLLVFLVLSKVSYSNILTIPTTCVNLLPDIDPYLNFLNEVGSLWIDTNHKMSKKIFKVLAYGNMYNNEGSSSDNPIFYIIKNNLCKAYELNDNKVFTSNAQNIRTYLNQNIDAMLKMSKEEYLKLKVKNHLSTISQRQLQKNIALIAKTKEEARQEALNEAVVEFNKKLKF